MSDIEIKEVVRERYAEAARNVRAAGSCCGGSDAARAGVSAITGNLYSGHETSAVPEKAVG